MLLPRAFLVCWSLLFLFVVFYQVLLIDRRHEVELQNHIAAISNDEKNELAEFTQAESETAMPCELFCSVYFCHLRSALCLCFWSSSARSSTATSVVFDDTRAWETSKPVDHVVRSGLLISFVALCAVICLFFRLATAPSFRHRSSSQGATEKVRILNYYLMCSLFFLPFVAAALFSDTANFISTKSQSISHQTATSRQCKQQ